MQIKKLYSIIFIIFFLNISTALICDNGFSQIGKETTHTRDFELYLANDRIIIKLNQELEISALHITDDIVLTGIRSLDYLNKQYKATKLIQLFPGSEESLLASEIGLTRIYRIHFDKVADVGELVNAYANDPHVELAQPVGIHKTAGITPNDTYYYQQWDMNKIQCPNAWEVTQGDTSILLAIVDTGVDWLHPDLGGSSPYLQGNIWINWAEYGGTSGVDDDGNGYIDDIRGWDWVDVGASSSPSPWPGEDASDEDNNPMDFNGHGTHCAGISSAITNNATGVAGLGWQCKIMPLRVGWSVNVGYETGLVAMDYCAQAIYYAAQNGATAINCSWGSSNTGGLADAVTFATNMGLVVVSAAGDSDLPDASYLSSRHDCISVAATDSDDDRSSYSNYGFWVDVSAPGGDYPPTTNKIYSTYYDHNANSHTYDWLNGTSMAAPHVVGLVGLVRDQFPGLGWRDVKERLQYTSDNIDDLNPGYENGLLGEGRINAFAAVNQTTLPTYSTIFSENFNTGLPSSWIADIYWRDDDPGNRNNEFDDVYVSGTIKVGYDIWTPPFMIVDSDWIGSGVTIDASLISPTINCSMYSDIRLVFNNWFQNYYGGNVEIGDIDVSINGSTWQNVAKFTSNTSYNIVDAGREVIVRLPENVNFQSNVQIRWHYYNASYEWFWGIDNVNLIGSKKMENLSVQIAPSFQSSNGKSGDTLLYMKTVKNIGFPDDSYNLTVSDNIWTTTIWDSSGTIPLNNTGILNSGDTMDIIIKVEIASDAAQGDEDLAHIFATSTTDTSIFAEATIHTIISIPEWSVPITITGDGITFTRTFGGNADATDSYDAGTDVITAPPGMNYYVFFEITTFPNYLSTDMRGWVSPYNTNIDWTLKVINATGKTSTLTWDSTNLPTEGIFTLIGANGPVNMRTQNSISFSGDKKLTIKYSPSLSAIMVTSPNGGEKWEIASTHNITWTSTNFTDPVKIEYSTDGGVTWLAPPIVSNTANDGSHPWTIPNTPSSNCKVRISDALDGAPSDVSDNVFTLFQPVSGWNAPITISSGTTQFDLAFGGNANATDGYDTGLDVAAAPPGMTYYVYFEIPQFPNYLDTDIRAWVSPYQSDIDWTLKVVNATGKTSTISWNPANLPSEGTFKLEGANSPLDMRSQSSVTFTGDKVLIIKYRSGQPSVTITAPNGGEKWAVGSTQYITWKSENFTDPVKIEYSTDGGTTWLQPPISNNTPNDGSHPWTIPNTPSSNCKVRISDAVDGAPQDTSDNAFTISEEDIVDIWLPTDTTSAPNSIVTIPIYVRDVTNKEIYSVLMTANTDTNVLTPLKATTMGTIANAWGPATYSISNSDIIISLAGTSPLIGDGNQVLVYIQYQVGSVPEAETAITLKNVMFNEGQPQANIKNGNFAISSNFRLSGKINYYYNNQSVPQVLMSLTGDIVRSTYTDTSGSYELTDLVGGNYVLKPGKVNETGNSISPYDASMILRYTVELISLTPYQLIAADVSGNGQVSPLDASYILRYTVGIISQFPVGNDWTFVPKTFPIDTTNWSTAPDSLRYESLISDTLNQNFVGIIFGDVSGNWANSNDLGSSMMTEFNVGNIQNNNDGKWLIPLEMEFSDKAYSGSFKVLFNNPDLKFVSSSIDNSLTDNMLFTFNAFSGGVNFAFASAQPLNEQALKINIFFEKIKFVTPSVSNFEFVDVVVDEKSATVAMVDNQLSKQIPVEWHLGQNYPNPFNAETSISYQVPMHSHVTIEIFNLVGQRLCTIVNEDKIPGTYKVIWNGKDDQGRSVGSGIYIYRMKAGEFNSFKKMVLVQ